MLLESFKFTDDKFGDYIIAFHAPPAAQINFISSTSNMRGTLLHTTRAYKGIYEPSLYDPSVNTSSQFHEDYTHEDAIEDIQATKLQTPLEMIHTLWLLRDVSRAFTHQLVRYRVGTAFVQESMRFFGMKKIFKVLVTIDCTVDNFCGSHFAVYAEGVNQAVKTYVTLLSQDVPDQDARGVLPTNILTNIYFDCSLRTLQNMFAQRMCCQAQQGEWQPILQKMRNSLKSICGDEIDEILKPPYEKGKDCGYRASFDRPCTWRKEDV